MNVDRTGVYWWAATSTVASVALVGLRVHTKALIEIKQSEIQVHSNIRWGILPDNFTFNRFCVLSETAKQTFYLLIINDVPFLSLKVTIYQSHKSCCVQLNPVKLWYWTCWHTVWDSRAAESGLKETPDLFWIITTTVMERSLLPSFLSQEEKNEVSIPFLNK